MLPSGDPIGPAQDRRGPMTWLWFVAGLASVGVGAVGVVVPGLPTTVFFIVAAACFARSSPKLERWVLDLPRIGPVVRDHRAGLGMPRRAKVVAITMIVAVSLASGIFALDRLALRVTVVALGMVGAAYVCFRVPTRERVLTERSSRAG